MPQGFTLAEVLITLGIIGVVAALTLPTLVQHHRKSVVETRLAKFYSTINQAIQRAEVDYGDRKNWDVIENGFEEDEDGNTDYTKSKILPWFNRYLKPYLNVAQIDDSTASEGRILVYLNDGSAVSIAQTWLFYPDAKKIVHKVNEINGLNTADRKNGGIDFFTFQFYPEKGLGVEPFQYYQDEERLKTDSSQGCMKDNINPLSERALCAALIKKNGWKIPSDYPLKF